MRDYKDQDENIFLSSGSRYSIITNWVTIAVYSRSFAASESYETFQAFNLISVSMFKYFMLSNSVDTGPIYNRLAEEKKIYESIADWRRKIKLSLPLGEDALIFDEVKISASIYCNSESNKFIG